jgi:hypothetical protein
MIGWETHEKGIGVICAGLEEDLRSKASANANWLTLDQ